MGDQFEIQNMWSETSPSCQCQRWYCSRESRKAASTWLWRSVLLYICHLIFINIYRWQTGCRIVNGLDIIAYIVVWCHRSVWNNYLMVLIVKCDCIMLYVSTACTVSCRTGGLLSLFVESGEAIPLSFGLLNSFSSTDCWLLRVRAPWMGLLFCVT